MQELIITKNKQQSWKRLKPTNSTFHRNLKPTKFYSKKSSKIIRTNCKKRLRKTKRSSMKNSKLCFCKTNNKSKKNNSKTYRIKLRNGTSRQIKVIEIRPNFKRSKPINLNFKKNWKLNNNKSKRSSKQIRINCKKSLMLSKFSYNNNFMPTR